MKPNQFLQAGTSLSNVDSKNSQLLKSVRAKIVCPAITNFNVGGRHQFIVRFVQANTALFAGY